MTHRPRICDSIRVDRELTAARYADGTYRDGHKRSVVHYDGREYLFGIDKNRRRVEVWERDGRRCKRCGVYVTFELMELDHIAPNVGQMRHDNLDNLRTLCGPMQNKCHRGGRNSKHA